MYTRIRIAEAELERLEKQVGSVPGSGSGTVPEAEACRDHLDVALESIGITDTEEDDAMVGHEDVVSAYRGLFAARRELIYLRYYAAKGREKQREQPGERQPADGRPEPGSVGSLVQREATKVLTRAENELSGWPLFVILRMLTEDGSQLRSDLDIDTVVDAQAVHDEQALKRIETVDILERQHRTFMWGTVLSSAGIVLLAAVIPHLPSIVSAVLFSLGADGVAAAVGTGAGTTTTPGFFGGLLADFGTTGIVAVALFGLLGASISGLFTFRGVSSSSRLSLGTFDLKTLAYARLAIGVGSALALVMIVESGVMEGVLFGPDAFSQPAKVLMIAFVAGFSERLLTRALAKVSGDEESKSDIPSMLRYERRAGGTRSPPPSAEDTRKQPSD